jgi:hypothetical protein
MMFIPPSLPSLEASDSDGEPPWWFWVWFWLLIVAMVAFTILAVES